MANQPNDTRPQLNETFNQFADRMRREHSDWDEARIIKEAGKYKFLESVDTFDGTYAWMNEDQKAAARTAYFGVGADKTAHAGGGGGSVARNNDFVRFITKHGKEIMGGKYDAFLAEMRNNQNSPGVWTSILYKYSAKKEMDQLKRMDSLDRSDAEVNTKTFDQWTSYYRHTYGLSQTDAIIMMSKEAKNGKITVVSSGEGADLLFLTGAAWHEVNNPSCLYVPPDSHINRPGAHPLDERLPLYGPQGASLTDTLASGSGHWGAQSVAQALGIDFPPDRKFQWLKNTTFEEFYELTGYKDPDKYFEDHAKDIDPIQEFEARQAAVLKDKQIAYVVSNMTTNTNVKEKGKLPPALATDLFNEIAKEKDSTKWEAIRDKFYAGESNTLLIANYEANMASPGNLYTMQNMIERQHPEWPQAFKDEALEKMKLLPSTFTKDGGVMTQPVWQQVIFDTDKAFETYELAKFHEDEKADMAKVTARDVKLGKLTKDEPGFEDPGTWVEKPYLEEGNVKVPANINPEEKIESKHFQRTTHLPVRRWEYYKKFHSWYLLPGDEAEPYSQPTAGEVASDVAGFVLGEVLEGAAFLALSTLAPGVGTALAYGLMIKTVADASDMMANNPEALPGYLADNLLSMAVGGISDHILWGSHGTGHLDASSAANIDGSANPSNIKTYTDAVANVNAGNPHFLTRTDEVSTRDVFAAQDSPLEIGNGNPLAKINHLLQANDYVVPSDTATPLGETAKAALDMTDAARIAENKRLLDLNTDPSGNGSGEGVGTKQLEASNINPHTGLPYQPGDTQPINIPYSNPTNPNDSGMNYIYPQPAPPPPVQGPMTADQYARHNLLQADYLDWQDGAILLPTSRTMEMDISDGIELMSIGRRAQRKFGGADQVFDKMYYASKEMLKDGNVQLREASLAMGPDGKIGYTLGGIRAIDPSSSETKVFNTPGAVDIHWHPDYTIVPNRWSAGGSLSPSDIGVNSIRAGRGMAAVTKNAFGEDWMYYTDTKLTAAQLTRLETQFNAELFRRYQVEVATGIDPFKDPTFQSRAVQETWDTLKANGWDINIAEVPLNDAAIAAAETLRTDADYVAQYERSFPGEGMVIFEKVFGRPPNP